MESFLFWIFSIVGVFCGGMVVWRQNAMGSAIYLVVTMLCISGLYALLQSGFVAALQVLIYAGAVMVLMLFVIMMLSTQSEDEAREGSLPLWVGAGVVGLIVLVKFITIVNYGAPPPASDDFGSIQGVGTRLFGSHVLPFEMISVLLLIAVIGVVILAKRKAV